MCKKCERKNIISGIYTPKLKAKCLNCFTALTGLNGEHYPVNKINVKVTETQIETWRANGYDIVIESG